MNCDIVEAVRKHAREHYSQGWDVIEETFTDAELTQLIGSCRTAKGAIRKVARFVGIVAKRQREMDAERF